MNETDEFNQTGRLRLGVDIGGTKVEAAALDASGAVRARRRASTPGSYEGLIATVRDVLGAVEAEVGPCATVGVGHPGSISPLTGLIRNANSERLNGKALDRDLAAALGRPVRLANDADCFALSEAVDGAGAGSPIVFGVILGTGVGGGVVIDGKLHDGAQRIAGEWGHNPLPWPTREEWPGPACWCGRTGCHEVWLSGPGLAAAFERDTGRRMSAEEIADAAARGDAAARAALELYADRLARGLASVLNLIDAHVVVLGGGVSNIAGVCDGAAERLPRYVFSDYVATRIVVNRHGDSSGVRGAAWLWSLEEAEEQARGAAAAR
jgi:fructokinase